MRLPGRASTEAVAKPTGAAVEPTRASAPASSSASSTVLAAPVGWPDITDEVAEAGFLALQGLEDEAKEALDALRSKYPGHPDLERQDPVHSATAAPPPRVLRPSVPTVRVEPIAAVPTTASESAGAPAVTLSADPVAGVDLEERVQRRITVVSDGPPKMIDPNALEVSAPTAARDPVDAADTDALEFDVDAGDFGGAALPTAISISAPQSSTGQEAFDDDDETFVETEFERQDRTVVSKGPPAPPDPSLLELVPAKDGVAAPLRAVDVLDEPSEALATNEGTVIARMPMPPAPYRGPGGESNPPLVPISEGVPRGGTMPPVAAAPGDGEAARGGTMPPTGGGATPSVNPVPPPAPGRTMPPMPGVARPRGGGTPMATPAAVPAPPRSSAPRGATTVSRSGPAAPRPVAAAPPPPRRPGGVVARPAAAPRAELADDALVSEEAPTLEQPADNDPALAAGLDRAGEAASRPAEAASSSLGSAGVVSPRTTVIPDGPPGAPPMPAPFGGAQPLGSAPVADAAPPAVTRETVIAPAPAGPPSQSNAGGARVVMLGSRGEAVAERGIDEGGHLEVGRAPGLPWAEDEFIAPQHARLHASGDGVVVEDLDPQGGVFLRIIGAQVIRDGDQMRIGQSLLAYERGEGEGPAGIWGRVLVRAHPEKQIQAYPLGSSGMRFGREVGEVTFPSDTFVSSAHCRLRCAPDGVWLEDLDSSNGTYIRLRSGDRVEFGNSILIGQTQFVVRGR